MILLVLMASILILVVTIYQYDEQTRDYNIQRFERKETITKETIELELKNKTSYPLTTENLPKIFQDRIYEISSINKLNITIFDLKGNLLKTSIGNVFEKNEIEPLPSEVVTELAQNSNHRIRLRSRCGNWQYPAGSRQLSSVLAAPCWGSRISRWANCWFARQGNRRSTGFRPSHFANT